MGLPGAVVPIQHKRAATQRAVKATRPPVGRNGLLGAQWDSGRRLPDAQGIALHTAPTQEAISFHQMGHYQRPLELDALLEAGDPDSAAVWKRILRAVEDLQRAKPSSGEVVH